MKKLVFIMDDFGVHESVSYLVRDILRNKIQKMHDDYVTELQADFDKKIAQYANQAFLAENKFQKELENRLSQGGADDSGRVASPTESIGGVRDIPDQN